MAHSVWNPEVLMDSGTRNPMVTERPDTTPTDRPTDKPTDKESDKGSGGGEGRIRCPLCRWEPRAQDRWACTCRHLWNTFDTGGVCPGCLKQWAMTMCLSCGKWSAHSAWYPKD